MSTLVMATADLPLDPGEWSIGTLQARTGSNSFYRATASTTHTISFPFNTPTSSPIYWRTCFRHNHASDYYRLHGRVLNSDGNALISFTGETTQALSIRQGTSTGTVLHTITNAVLTNVWQVVEIYCSTTTVTVKFNGVEVYHNTGLTFNITDLARLRYSGVGIQSNTWQGYIDDIVVCTDKWPGLGGLHVFQPTGAGSVTDWQDALPNLNTPAATSGTKHRFTIDDAPASAAIVHRLGVGYTGKVNGQGYGAIKSLLNNDPGDENALSVSPQYFQQYWPGVTLNDFNNLEIGVQSA